MERKSIADINQYCGSSINPSDTPDTIYELYSVPSYENQVPEIIKGKEIGSSKITVEDGDVLICKINPRINRVWVVKRHTPYQLLASSEWIVIRNHELNSDYLKWYFSSPLFRELMTSQVAGIGGSLTRAQPKQVAKYPVPIVKVGEQRKIAAVLDKVSDLIAKRRQQLDKLDEMVKSRFVEMFGSPILNSLGWKKEFLKDVCTKLNDGTHFSPESFETGEYKYITAKNIKMSGFDFTNITYVPEEIHRSIYERCNPELGDVLYIKDGATTGIAMVNTLEEEFTLLSSVALLKQDRKRINGYFLAALLNNEDMYADIRRNMGGAAITRLTIAKLNTIQVILPPINLQNQFAAFVEQTEKTKTAVSKSLEKLETLKKALMQEYFG